MEFLLFRNEKVKVVRIKHCHIFFLLVQPIFSNPCPIFDDRILFWSQKQVTIEPRANTTKQFLLKETTIA
jgi:hypothetical protein